MKIDQLFEPGAQWKHREREFLILISKVVEPGRFTLAFVDKHPEHFEADRVDILWGTWSAEELVRDFDPMPVRATRYDHIHNEDLFDGD